MKSEVFSVVFMGNGPVAAKSLELMNNWANIEFVVTKQKPPHHKDLAPVEEFCKKNNLPFFYANNKNDLAACIYSNKPASPVAVVVDYGVIIDLQSINYFNKGIVNSHFSLLPHWRGADPITYSLLSGQTTTGVSLMLIDEGLDTGALLAKEQLAITNQDNNQLTEQLINISNKMLRSILPEYIAGKLSGHPQDTQNTVVTYSRMLTKRDGQINTSKPASIIEREIRAYKQWPKSRLTHKDSVFIITNAVESTTKVARGQLQIIDNGLFLGCKDSCLEIKSIKPAGKNEMTASAFINGYGHLINN